MGDSYVGWGVVFLLASLAAACIIHRYYTSISHNTFPLWTHACLILAVFVCVLPFPLLVLDVDAGLSAVRYNQEANPEQWFRPVWFTILILTQIMAWVVLPVAQEMDCAGDFEWKKRFLRAIKENVKLYMVLGCVVALLMGYIVFLKGLTDFTSIVHLVIAAANAFGLLLIVVFLACGLVGLPRLLWRSADPTTMLRRHFFDATDIQEDVDVAAMDLAEVKAELTAITPRVSDEDSPLLQLMLEKIQEADTNLPFYHSASSRLKASAVANDGDVSRSKLVQLHAKMKKSIKIATKKNYQWDSMVSECQLYDAIVHNNSDSLSGWQRTYYTAVRRPLLRILAVCAGILSVLILWSELMLPFQSVTHRSLSVVEVVVHNKQLQFVGSTIFLFYMALCSYWATFQFKVFDLFHVLPAVSDAASLCFTATFLTRLILPLCYNFLWIADLADNAHKVIYSEIFGKMDVVDFLGPWFNRFIPVFIPVIAVLIELKVFDKVLESMGIDRHDPNNLMNPEVTQKISDGRKLVASNVGKEMGSVSPSHARSSSDVPSNGVAVPVTEEAKPERGRRYAEYKARKAAENGEN